ncbi:hypothetical protein M573_112042 [Prevotella intermedia ZT]|uniref:Uncharacterized protein n=1 Tax=Prevotella intermedia ZT TaxID=1347790 RepID=A0AAP0V5M9_PREIN|nr:hypothetical protein M573_112042 [Prevotella intermedia ZT]
MRILACFTVRKLTIQGFYFAHINKLNRYSLQYNKEQPRRQTLPYFTAFQPLRTHCLANIAL